MTKFAKFVLWAIAIIGVLMFVIAITSCSNVDGALVNKRIVLRCTAPSGSKLTTTLRCDQYIAYYSTNPTDLKTKPLTQLSSVIANNQPGTPGQADSLVIDHLFPTGRTVYYKALAAKYVWLSATADTTRADSTLTLVVGDSLSNYATRYFPPEPEEKPATVKSLTGIDLGGGPIYPMIGWTGVSFTKVNVL